MIFTDENGDPIVPTTVDYQIFDRTNDTEVVPWTALPSPTSTMNFIVTGDRNAIEDESHVKEIQIFGIRVDNNLAGEGYSEIIYNVLNLEAPIGA